MLLQFNFKNFKSFREETTLDMSATGISEFKNHIVQIGNEKVLPIAAIYGANASGKSNVIEAFRFMSEYVAYSFAFGGDDSSENEQFETLKPKPFLFDKNTKNQESKFEVYFVSSEESGSKLYNYGFTVNDEGVQEEWLNYKAKSSRGDYKRIFYRTGDKLSLDGIPKPSRENIEVSLEKEALIVSLGAKLKIVKLKQIRDWFLSNEFADFGRPEENYFLSRRLPEGFVDKNEVQKKVVDFISSFDTSIIGFKVEVIDGKKENGSTRVKVDAVHKMTESDELTTIPLHMESAGTLKMFALYPMLQEVLENGGVFFVDELNARLHPLLVRTFIIAFLNPDINKKKAQLVFTSHDSWQLNNNILRRDEIWFAEKDDFGVSTLYSLSDFSDDEGDKIRKDENYEKNYLLGKYGAIPRMKHFNIVQEGD